MLEQDLNELNKIIDNENIALFNLKIIESGLKMYQLVSILEYSIRYSIRHKRNKIIEEIIKMKELEYLYRFFKKALDMTILFENREAFLIIYNQYIKNRELSSQEKLEYLPYLI